MQSMKIGNCIDCSSQKSTTLRGYAIDRMNSAKNEVCWDRINVKNEVCWDRINVKN